ncbi:lipase 1-like [Plodia interpunctella]|uniref:lipase 1-like n=1 Tax=Plodia interpunctella TaxID=58824 RepID=UPI002368BE21|nr:lipase 1-like [Plodia interpunctella]
MLRLHHFLLLGVLVVISTARRSPNADYVEKLFRTGEYAGRYSDNIIEDALLDVPGLVAKYGYPIEVHTVTTPDGYILEVHRIPHGRDQNNTPDPNKPVVFLFHGLISSSADYIVLGPGNALAYILAEAGYDVWLGNARGNFYSRRHVSLSPSFGRANVDFWKFSWDEIGDIDLPAMIDYIIEETGQPKMHYIGHSQGCTSFLVLNALRPEYSEKFISFQALSPGAFFIYNDNLFYRLSILEGVLEETAYAIGLGEVLGSRQFFTWFGTNVCTQGPALGFICDSLLNLNNPDYYNSTMTPLFFGHAPAGSSVRQVMHYAQGLNTHKFRRYNDIPIRNIERYGRPTPPEYDLNRVTVPTHLYYSYSDDIAHYLDVEHLADNLPNVIDRIIMERFSFTHFDFIWGIDVKEQLYDKLLEIMLSYH